MIVRSTIHSSRWSRIFPLLVVVLVSQFWALTTTSPVTAQTPRWVELPPPPLANGEGIYDPERNRMLIVGGSLDAGIHGTIWAFSLGSEGSWSELQVEGPTPGYARGTVVYDPVRDRLIAIVGRGIYDEPGAVWALPLNEFPLVWEAIPTTGVFPSSKGGFSTIYDPVRDRVLLFGGNVGFSFPQFTSQVWALSLSEGPAWNELAVAGTPPLGRTEHTAVYDPANDRMIVFGGYYYRNFINQVILDESWSLSLSGTPTWTFLSPDLPILPHRKNHVAAVDPLGQRMIVFGGQSASDTTLSDTWALDLTAGDRAKWALLPAGPAARWGHSACYDTTAHRLLIYGGWSPLGRFQLVKRTDLWALGSSPADQWSLLSPFDEPPIPLVSFGAAIDPTESRMFTFGGWSPAGPFERVQMRRLDQNVGWQVLAPAPAGSIQGAAVWTDTIGDRALLFGGRSLAYFNDLWSFDYSNLSWTLIQPATQPPPPRYGALGLFDSKRRQGLVYGGGAEGVIFDDTWIFDVATNRWEPLSAGTLGGRFDMTGIYDPVLDRFIAYGGADTLGPYNDVHVLDPEDDRVWVPLAVNGTPPPLRDFRNTRAIYDRSADRMLVFGLLTSSYPVKLAVWALSLTEPATWTTVDAGGRQPRGRGNFEVVADPSRGRAIVYGGYYNEDHNDTWAFYFDWRTPVQVSVSSVEASPELVRVTWYSGSGGPTSATSYRKAGGEDWSAIATIAATGRGEFVLEDSDVLPGQHYSYRLGIIGEGGEEFVGEITVDVPWQTRFDLSGAFPNPGPGPLRVSFSISSSAKLEVFDIGGRRICSRQLDQMPAGTHTLLLDETKGLKAGLYWIRLTEGTRSASAKAVVLP